VSLLGGWQRDRDVGRKASAYVEGLMTEPDREDVAWLAQTATGGDADHAAWELRYARRALGLIVAERDALDDLTASVVARELMAAFARDPNVAKDKLDIAEAQFNARLSAYRDAIQTGGDVASGAQLGLTLIAFSGGSFRGREAAVARAGDILARVVSDANTALRTEFGTSSLPEHIVPSALPTRPL
jgi:hypothetical protein